MMDYNALLVELFLKIYRRPSEFLLYKYDIRDYYSFWNFQLIKNFFLDFVNPSSITMLRPKGNPSKKSQDIRIGPKKGRISCSRFPKDYHSSLGVGLALPRGTDPSRYFKLNFYETLYCHEICKPSCSYFEKYWSGFL